jgi:hypothetical protein
MSGESTFAALFFLFFLSRVFGPVLASSAQSTVMGEQPSFAWILASPNIQKHQKKGRYKFGWRIYLTE